MLTWSLLGFAGLAQQYSGFRGNGSLAVGALGIEVASGFWVRTIASVGHTAGVALGALSGLGRRRLLTIHKSSDLTPVEHRGAKDKYARGKSFFKRVSDEKRINAAV